MNKASIRDVGMAMHYLGVVEKYTKAFEKNPEIFKLRCYLNNEIFEVDSNEIIQNEVAKFLEERRAMNQKVLDENPEIVKQIEDYDTHTNIN